MTREEARRAAEVMMAYADGKEIEYYNTTNEIWETHSNPFFNWGTNDYRIKTEPTYRPFKDKEECWAEMQKHQPFGWVYEKLSTTYINIHSIDSEGDYNIIFEKFTFADGTPFGIKEE